MNKINIIKYIIALFLIVSIVVYFTENIESLRYFKNISIPKFLCLTASIMLLYFFGSINLFILLKQRKPDLKWNLWIRYYLIKRFLNMHIPQAGNVYEAMKLKEKFGIEYIDYGSSFSAVNWFTIFFNLALATIISSIDYFSNGVTTKIFLIISILILLLVILIPFFLETFVFKLKMFQRSKRISMIANNIHLILTTMRQDIFKPSVLCSLAFWSSLLFISNILSFYFVFQTIKFEIGIFELIPFVVLSLLTSITNIIPGNLGVGEYAFGFLGVVYGMELSIGIIIFFIIRLAIYFLFLLILACMFLLNLCKKHE